MPSTVFGNLLNRNRFQFTSTEQSCPLPFLIASFAYKKCKVLPPSPSPPSGSLTGQCPSWVNNGPWVASELGPLIPQQRTCSDYCGISVWCPIAEAIQTIQPEPIMPR